MVVGGAVGGVGIVVMGGVSRLSTGDLGFFDDNGYLYVVGRFDDVINIGGEKVMPEEIDYVKEWNGKFVFLIPEVKILK